MVFEFMFLSSPGVGTVLACASVQWPLLVYRNQVVRFNGSVHGEVCVQFFVHRQDETVTERKETK